MAQTKLHIPQFADGVDGELITWNSSGVPSTVAVGTAGHVLTSNGTGAAPTFQAVSSGGNGIYGGSDTIASAAVATVTSSSSFTIDYSNGQNGIYVNDNPDGKGIVIYAPNGKHDISWYSAGLFLNADVDSTTTPTGFSFTSTGTTGGTQTTDALKFISTQGEFIPTSGTATFTELEVAPLINQTGGASGASRSVHIIPSLAAVGSGGHTALEITASGQRALYTTAGSVRFDLGTDANYDLYYRGTNGNLTRLPIGATSGHVLTTNGTGAAPTWQAAGGGGLPADADYGDIVVSGTGTVWTIDTNVVSNTKFRQSAGLSVVGRSSNTTGDVADITGTDTQVLRVSGSTLGFGTIGNASIADVSVAKLTSGTLAGGLTTTLANSTNYTIAYNGTNPAIQVDDLNSTVNIFSEDGTQYVSTTNTLVGIGSGTSKMEYIDGVLRIYDSDATHFVGIQTPATASLTTSYTLTLPTTDGTPSQVLTTDGSGGLSWTTPSTASGDVTGPGSAVDNQVALFQLTTGKIIKAATSTGIATLASGVLSTVTAPSGTVVGNSDTQTLTNKRIDPRVTSTTSTTTPTPNIANEDMYILTALAGNATFGSPTGTPVQGNKLIIRIKDNGTSRTLTWNSVYRGIGLTLPTTTVVNKTMYLGFIYNSTDTKWDLIASTIEA